MTTAVRAFSLEKNCTTAAATKRLTVRTRPAQAGTKKKNSAPSPLLLTVVADRGKNSRCYASQQAYLRIKTSYDTVPLVKIKIAFRGQKKRKIQ